MNWLLKSDYEKATIWDLFTVLMLVVILVMLSIPFIHSHEKPAETQQSVFFQPDTINLEVGGQIFRYGALTVFGEDTVTISAFLHDPTAVKQ